MVSVVSKRVISSYDHYFGSLGLSKNAEVGRRRVTTCALKLLAGIWALAVIGALISRFYLAPIYFKQTKPSQLAWLLFTFLGIAVTWVVIARAVDNFIRMLLFVSWVFSLVAVVAWGGIIAGIGDEIIFFAIGTMSSLMVMSVLTKRINFNLPWAAFVVYSTGVLFTLLTLLLVTPLIIPGLNRFDLIVPATVVLLYIWLQMASMWNYLHRNRHVWLVNNTCVFAMMAPWTETVDAFQVFSSHR